MDARDRRAPRNRAARSSRTCGGDGGLESATSCLAAVELADVGAIVSGGGRPDLAAGALERVTAPTLLIVGGRDPQGLELNREAPRAMPCETRLEIVPGGHLFEEPGGQLERVADLATEWFGAI
jgi:putative phosphoribosyl transferase